MYLNPVSSFRHRKLHHTPVLGDPKIHGMSSRFKARDRGETWPLGGEILEKVELVIAGRMFGYICNTLIQSTRA